MPTDTRDVDDWMSDIEEMLHGLEQTSDPPTDDELFAMITEQLDSVVYRMERSEPTEEQVKTTYTALVQSLTALNMIDTELEVEDLA